jgi:twitching motility protein PilT
VSEPVRDDVRALLDAVAQRGGSDLLFAPGRPPTARVDGELVAMDESRLTPADTEAFARELAGRRWDELTLRREVDFSFSLGDMARVRANIFYQRGTLAGALRLVPYVIPSLEALGAPAVCAELTRQPHGLVLVTGPTGAGKSTTLAAMIDRINRDRATHIITIEDPIEYVHHHQRSLIVQREVGSDTLDFARGLRAALRENPDVVLVGEMRDIETVAATLTLAETGHLVFATLHTNDTAQAVDRIIDVFPSGQQRQIQLQLSQTLLAVLHQRLLPRADGAGRVAAFEVMLATPAVRNLVKDGKSNQLRNVIATSATAGMRTLEADLRRLATDGLVSWGAATGATLRPEELAR